MAQPIICDECQQAEASFMLTDLDKGETRGYCSTDFAVVAAGIALAAIPAEVLLEMIGPVHVVKAAEQMQAAKTERAAKRKGAKAADQEPRSEAAEAVAESEAAAADGGA